MADSSIHAWLNGPGTRRNYGNTHGTASESLPDLSFRNWKKQEHIARVRDGSETIWFILALVHAL